MTKDASSPLTKEDLIRELASGCKPQDAWRIGTEHERFIYNQKTLRRVPYEKGIESILENLQAYGWSPLFEEERLISLKRDQAAITLEPGGQFELSGAPLSTLHETVTEIQNYHQELQKTLKSLGFFSVNLGCDPKWAMKDRVWMPKGRYEIMRPYMAKKGNHGQDMMTATCTVQVNLDFSSEEDMIKKFRVGLALQPISIGLFGNSGIFEGKSSGFESYRSYIWSDTDPDRCGLLPFVFEDGMGFERYVDYALDVPMYFVHRKGHYINASGQSFRDFMKGELPALPGEKPTLEDWENHLTTLFPEVRMKKFLEMRGVDSVPGPHLYALPAFWTGLLYDPGVLDQAYELIRSWTLAEREFLYRTVPRQGLATPFRKRTVREVAQDVVALAKEGLQKRGKLNKEKQDESLYLRPLEEILEKNETLAQKHLKDFKNIHREDVDGFLRSFIVK